MNGRGVRVAVVAVASVLCLALALTQVDFAQLSTTLAGLSGWHVGLAVLGLAANALVGVVRFRVMMAALGYRLPWSRIFVAFSAGQAGNQFLFSVIGQSVTRAGVLQPARVPFGATIAATLVERLIAAALLAALSLGAAWFLIPEFGFSLQQGGFYFLSLVTGVGCIAVVVAVASGFRVGPWLRAADLPVLVRRYWGVVALTLLAQACMLGAYLAALQAVGPAEVSVEVMAAMLVVMFTASLPIAFAGWGVREFTAVVALGAIGVGSAEALVVALSIGLLSLALVLAIGVVSLMMAARARSAPAASHRAAAPDVDWNARLVMICGVVTAVAIYLQVRVSSQGSLISVNLADAIALGGFGMGLVMLITRRSLGAMPVGVAVALALVSAMIVQGLAVAALGFGWTEWALLNRGLGWLVVAGYPILGMAVATIGGTSGRIAVLRILILAGATIAALQLVALMVVRLGVKQLPEDLFIVPLEGYANNSNAFAFQLVVLTVATLVARDLGLFVRRNAWPAVILALAGASIYFATSRAGLGMFGLALVLYVALSPQRLSALGLALRSLGLALLVVLAGLYAPELTGALAPGTPVSLGFDPVSEQSDSERWSTISEGFDMWLTNPIFGSGLGAYIREVLADGRDMIVIHSTPVWVLAEMGALGLILIGAAFVSLTRVAVGLLRRPEGRAWGMGGAILLVGFGAGNMVHDLFFQRSFWFLLGLCLSVAGAGGLAEQPVHRRGTGTAES